MKIILSLELLSLYLIDVEQPLPHAKILRIAETNFNEGIVLVSI